METVAFYETTYAERDHGYAVSVLMLPARAIEGWSDVDVSDRADIAQDLDLEFLSEVAAAAMLPSVVASVIAFPEDVTAAMAAFADGDHDTARYEFAERASFARVVAAETSPLGAESVAGLMTTKPVSGAAGIGLAVVAFGPTPLVLIAAPVGIILVGASTGVAEALHRGLRTRLLRKMGVDEEADAMAESA